MNSAQNEPMDVAVFDTKPYDRQYLAAADVPQRLRWRWLDFRLSHDTVAAARGAPAICVFVNDPVDAPVLEALAQQGTQLLTLRCAGFNHVDLQAAQQFGIRVSRVPAYSPHAVAEHTVGLLMTLNRKIHRAFNRVRELNFSLNGLIGFDLHGKQIGILGTGKIGRITAQIFRGFGANVVAYDPFPQVDWAAEYGVTYAPFAQVLATSDILSLHLPLSPDSHHLLNQETLAATKRGVVILNTSRGKLIDTTALIQALKTGQVGGVALDVYEEEEGIFFQDLSGEVLQDDELARLLGFPNVLITAHQAFLTHEALCEIAGVTVENLHRHALGLPLLPGTVLTEEGNGSA